MQREKIRNTEQYTSGRFFFSNKNETNILSSVILPVVKVVWGLFTSHGTFNDILMLVNVFLSLKIILPKTLQLKTGDFLQQTITMNENVQWQMIKDSVLFALSSGFFVSFLFEKKNRPEVYCSVFLLFSREF
jgi:hypothetical protein